MTAHNQIVKILGLKQKSQTERLIDIVHRGLPVAAFEAVGSYTGLTREALSGATAISLRTVQRRAAEDKRLQPDESDRLTRVARLYAFAEDVLGSQAAAVAWMRDPNRALDDATPLSYLDTEIAAREVEDLLGRIRYGVFS